MTSPWQDHFGLDQVPFWLDAFAANPDQAVDALLRRGFYHGHLGAAEPEDLLIDWAWRLEGELVERLDPALARWVERFWGTPAAEEGPTLWADAWSTLALVVATVDSLKLTARALRRRFGQASLFLGPLSVGPSRDPLPGRPGWLPTQAPHRPVRAEFPHTVPQVTGSLRDGHTA